MDLHILKKEIKTMIKYSQAKILTLFFFLTCIFSNQYLVTVEIFTETW